MGARRVVTRLQDLDDVGGSVGAGKVPIWDVGQSKFVLGDVATQAELDAAAAKKVEPSHIVGGYYGSLTEIQSTSGFTTNRLRVTPIFVRGGSFDRIAGNVVVAGAAGCVVRLGAYASAASGSPATLLFDAGVVDATSSGVKEIVIAQSLAAGVVWLADVVQITAANLQMTGGVSGSTAHYPMAYASGSLTFTPQTYFMDAVSGALPASFSFSIANVGGVATKVWLRAA